MLFWKRMGLESEEVCELGQWKDVKSFSGHYLRMGAMNRTPAVSGLGAQNLTGGLCGYRLISNSESAGESGGKDQEGEAHDTCPPTRPSLD